MMRKAIELGALFRDWLCFHICMHWPIPPLWMPVLWRFRMPPVWMTTYAHDYAYRDMWANGESRT